MRLCPFLLAIAVLLLLSGCADQTIETRQPASRLSGFNVVLITVDTLRADYLGCYGRESISTPNLDALAARGAKFTQAVVQVPLTLPSHACILTGTYPPRSGVRDNGAFALPATVPTVATLARQKGVETAAFVGAAVLNRRFGLDQGFDTYSDDTAEEKALKKLPGVVGEVRAEVVTRRAIDWLEQAVGRGSGLDGGRPFLVWLHYYDPHFPYDPPEPYRSRYPKDAYGGEIAYTDEQIGRVLGWLTRKGLDKRTLVFMLADHGESLGEHGEYTHGVFLYDSTIRVPMLAAGPGIRPGTVVRQQVRSIDVFPTLAEFLGVERGGQAQGESLAPLLREGRPARTIYSYMETLYPKVTMGWSELRGVRTEEWKFVAAPRAELYRLKEDPSEDRDLATLHPAEAQRLQKRVWEIGVPGESVAFKPLDDQTRRELESLGYINASAPREVRLNMSGPDPKDRRRVLAGLERAAELMNRDRFQAALPLLRQALHEDPANPSIYSQLGFCYQRMERFEEALQTYEQMIARRLDTDQTFAEIGELRLRRGELEKAIKAMEEAARRNPSNLQNLVNLATAYLQTSRPVDAERLLTSILAQNSRHAGAYNLLGVLEISRERREQAKLYLEKAIQHDPDLTEAYLNLGLLAHEAGRTRQAASYFRSFLERAKDKQFREVIPKVKAALADLESGS